MTGVRMNKNSLEVKQLRWRWWRGEKVLPIHLGC
jgi:hypothetical protein